MSDKKSSAVRKSDKKSSAVHKSDKKSSAVHKSDKKSSAVHKSDKKSSAVRKSDKNSSNSNPCMIPTGTINDTDDDNDDVNSDIELDDTIFSGLDFKENIHIFNPERYENNIHKEIIIVHPDNRKTSEIMSKFEYTEVISHRAKHIELGGPIFVDIKSESDIIKIAEMEIRQHKCPLAIRRMYNMTLGEIWDVNEMIPPI
jgi:DNA-directed RNA polymerase subunit K/omega